VSLTLRDDGNYAEGVWPMDGCDEKEPRMDLVWAEEVLTVYQHLGKATGRRALGSSSAKHLHEWASNPENETKFLTQMVPKATEIVQKYRPPDANSAVNTAERKTVADLQTRLQAAIDAARAKGVEFSV
jgi:hypothetical protein